MESPDTSRSSAPGQTANGSTRRTIAQPRIVGLSALGDPLKPLMKEKALLTDPLLNKGTAFTDAERDALGLRGSLPPRVFPIEEQLHRTLAALRRKTEAIEKYIYLVNLQNRNEVLFYRLVMEHLEEMVPLIYTPTVGEACIHYGSIFRRPRASSSPAMTAAGSRRSCGNWPHAAPA